MVLTGINSARRSAKSGKSATIRIRLSASGRTMNRNNSKDGRRRNSAGTPIDRRRTNSGARLRINAAIAKDRRKSNSVPSNVVNGTNSARRRSSGAGLISSVRTRNNVATPNFSDAIRDRQIDGGLMMDAALIRSVKLKSN